MCTIRTCRKHWPAAISKNALRYEAFIRQVGSSSCTGPCGRLRDCLPEHWLQPSADVRVRVLAVPVVVVMGVKKIIEHDRSSDSR
jgi:hypothetical protein